MTDELENILAKMQKDGCIAIDGDKVALKGSVPHAAMVFAFPDDSASFVNGFEAGMIWAAIERGDNPIDRGFDEGFPIHVENVEIAQRMAQSRGYRLETRECGAEGWVAALFTMAGDGRPRLTIVGE